MKSHHVALVWFVGGVCLGGGIQHERDRFQAGYYQRANDAAGRHLGQLLLKHHGDLLDREILLADCREALYRLQKHE